MAKVKFGMFMTDARGKVGGQVFSKNRSGSYVRTKVTPSNPRTSAQSLVRQSLGAISASWSGLTDAQINGWNGAVQNWASTNIFGDSANPSGKSLFVKLNLNLVNTQQAQVLEVPAKQDMPALGAPIATIDTTLGTISFTGLTAPAGFRMIISATPPQSRGTRFYKGKFRQIQVVASGSMVPATLYQAYEDRFGLILNDANIGIELKVVAPNGQAGVPVTMVANYV